MSAGTSDTLTPKEWSVRIFISARLGSTNHDVPGIGDELAVGRALANVACGLPQAAEEDADEMTHRRRYAGSASTA